MDIVTAEYVLGHFVVGTTELESGVSLLEDGTFYFCVESVPETSE